MTRRLPIAVVGVVAVAAIAQQLALPPLAEQRLRAQLARTGSVERVEVHAVPAVKLLWGRADRTVIRMRESTAGQQRLADLLAQSSATTRLDASVATLHIGPLTMRDALLRKRGDQLTGESSVTDADLRAALPPGFDVRPVAAGAGKLLFQGTATLLGQTVSARAVALARDGQVIVAPDVPFGGLLTLTVFSDPRIAVQDVGARGQPGGFTLTARARLRG